MMLKIPGFKTRISLWCSNQPKRTLGYTSDRSEMNYLMLNVSKTKELVIDFRQKPSYLPDLVIKGEKVERVSQYKYLGTVLDSWLNFDQNTALIQMLDLKLKDKIPCAEIRKRTKIIDIIEYTLKQKWKWAGHIARLKDNRWTRRCTEWQPRRGKRSRGRPSRRWQDDITEKEGTTWIRKATDRRRWKTLMEGYILQWMDKA